MEAVEPVYIFDPGTRGFTCSVEEKIFRVLDRHRSPHPSALCLLREENAA